MFFGTPHQGANAVDWANVATQLVRAAFLKPKKEFIEALRRDSEILTKLTDDFVPLAGEYAIVSFWEQDYLPGLRSAVLSRPNRCCLSEISLCPGCPKTFSSA